MYYVIKFKPFDDNDDWVGWALSVSLIFTSSCNFYILRWQLWRFRSCMRSLFVNDFFEIPDFLTFSNTWICQRECDNDDVFVASQKIYLHRATKNQVKYKSRTCCVRVITSYSYSVLLIFYCKCKTTSRIVV